MKSKGKKLYVKLLITLLDTAYIYGPERSEELVGQVVKEYPREKVQIATKGSHVIKKMKKLFKITIQNI